MLAYKSGLYVTFVGLLVLLAHSAHSATAGVSKVHVVFSNHLDIGFDGIDPVPGYDSNVINKYFTEYFPLAINLSASLRTAPGSRSPYIYTTHAYLLSLFLDCPSGMSLACPDEDAVASVRSAIQRGDLVWHAFPHNAQLELCDPDMVRYGIQLVQELDEEFSLPHKNTLSQRDIPGTTRAAIPLLVEKGVKAISVGVNGGSAPPGVPKNTPFIWRDPPSNTEVLAFWHPGGYGGYCQETEVDCPYECVHAEGFDEVLCLSWRGDNQGPHQNADQVRQVLDLVQQGFPGAEVAGSTFDAYVDALYDALPRLKLPLVTGEIGDTWIHGVQSDPGKTADYRALQRARRRCLASGSCGFQEDQLKNFSRILLKVPEHTWGLDVKKALDYTNGWSNAELHDLVRKDPGHLSLIYSWWRQRQYIPWAVQALGHSHPLLPFIHEEMGARQRLLSLTKPAAKYSQKELTSRSRKVAMFESHAWEIGVNTTTGTLAVLRRKYPEPTGGEGGANYRHKQKGINWAAGDSLFGQLLYSVYNEEAYNIIWEHYAYQAPNISFWFYGDFGKPGLDKAWRWRLDLEGRLQSLSHHKDSFGLTIRMEFSFSPWLVEKAGAPRRMWVVLESPADSEKLYWGVVWKSKTATRIPEALWLRFKPTDDSVDPDSWTMRKLGQDISPKEVIINGSLSLHAVQDEGVAVLSKPGEAKEKLRIYTLDAALVSPGRPCPFPNVVQPPDMAEGVSFNLVNNIWGTNYVMWTPWRKQDKDMAFRFALEAGGQEAAATQL